MVPAIGQQHPAHIEENYVEGKHRRLFVFSLSEECLMNSWACILSGISVTLREGESPACAIQLHVTLARRPIPALVLRLDRQHLLEPPCKPLFIGDELGADKRVHHLERQRRANNPRPQHA